ncbi:MAG: DegQ family serine endoprotease [Chromatiales bacterium]|jgi:serine protease Do
MTLLLLYGLWLAQATAGSLPDFTGMVEKYSPTVVNISTRQSASLKKSDPHHKFEIPELDEDNPLHDLLKRFFGDQLDIPELIERDSKSLGSGFIISEDGYILTNHHVVSSADEIVVRLTDRREFKAKLIGSDKASDIALIKIEAEDLPTVTLGSATELKVGEWVLAIGSPFGFDHSVTAGIVSAKGRNLPNENYVPFIQTDVAINPGNSGGPLFNLDGEVVGVNSQIYSRSGGFMGLSFSIPIDLAMNVVEQLKTHGRVARGYLGVLIQDVTHELAESFNMDRPRGALISRVLESSPAEAAGLQPGDVILSFNGRAVEKSSQLPPLVGTSPINKAADVEILRNGKLKHVEVSVQQLPDTEKMTRVDKPVEVEHDRIGLIIEDLDKQQRKDLGLESDTGVLVREVGSGVAKLAGIQRGDIIVMINNRKIGSKQDYLQVIRKAEPGKNMAFLINRDDASLFIAIRAPME